MTKQEPPLVFHDMHDIVRCGEDGNEHGDTKLWKAVCSQIVQHFSPRAACAVHNKINWARAVF